MKIYVKSAQSLTESKKQVAMMVRDFLIDDDVINDKLHNQIKRALGRNFDLTSTYALHVGDVLDIKGDNSATSGWYISLEGTRSGVKFFVNNDLEVVRKPVGGTVVAKYNLFNSPLFTDTFWEQYFG